MHYKNPKLAIYTLHSLHMHPSGFQCFIFVLNSDKDLEFLMAVGTSDHVLGPLKLIVSVPFYTVRILDVRNEGLERKL